MLRQNLIRCQYEISQFRKVLIQSVGIILQACSFPETRSQMCVRFCCIIIIIICHNDITNSFRSRASVTAAVEHVSTDVIAMLVVEESQMYGVDDDAADDEAGGGAASDDDVHPVHVPQVAEVGAFVVNAFLDHVHGVVVVKGDAVVETKVLFLRK